MQKTLLLPRGKDVAGKAQEDFEHHTLFDKLELYK